MTIINNHATSTYLEENWLAIFFAILTIVLSSKRLSDFGVHYKYTDLVITFLRVTIRTVSGAFLGILLIPLLLVTYILLWIFSMINDIYVRNTICKNVTRATGVDTYWGLHSIESPSFVLAILKVNGRANLDNFIEHIDRKVITSKSSSGYLQFPKLKQIFYIYGGYCYWKDDDTFDIRNHIYLKNLPEMYPEFSLKATVSGQDLVTKYLEDHGKTFTDNGNAPQWDIGILQTGKEEFFYLFRFHHAIADGISFLRLIQEYLNDEPITNRNVCPPKSMPVRISKILWAIMLIPYAIGLLLYKGRNNPLHGPKLNGKKHFIAIPGIPFEIIQKIKKSSNTSIQAVLFSAMLTAFGKHFQTRSSEPSWLTAIFPLGVNVPATELKLQNTFQIGMASLPIPSYRLVDGKYYQTDSPVTSLFKIDRALKRGDEDATVTSVYHLFTLFGNVIPVPIARIMYNSCGLTVGFTNVPGPSQKLVFLKQNITELRGWAPDRSPLGIIIAFVTYDGILRANISIDDALVNGREEAEDLGKNWLAEIKNLAMDMDIKEVSKYC